MKLSILIISIPSREERLDRLVQSLIPGTVPEVIEFSLGTIYRRVNESKGYEVLVYETRPYDKANPDDRLSYGGKRNVLGAASNGDYVCYVDDDDTIHPEYLRRILEAIDQGPDVVGFKVACYGYANNRQSPEIMEPADVSIRYKGWANDQNGFKYVRFPHHLAPTKREHALAIGYRGHYGEDHDYSIRMQASGRLKTEVHIDEFLYVYRFNAKKKAGE
jgi:glycosyltransferase involved in cell wall biosynthesis